MRGNRLHLRQGPHAPAAAAEPEIEHHHLAAVFLQGVRLALQVHRGPLRRRPVQHQRPLLGPLDVVAGVLLVVAQDGVDLLLEVGVLQFRAGHLEGGGRLVQEGLQVGGRDVAFAGRLAVGGVGREVALGVGGECLRPVGVVGLDLLQLERAAAGALVAAGLLVLHFDPGRQAALAVEGDCVREDEAVHVVEGAVPLGVELDVLLGRRRHQAVVEGLVQARVLDAPALGRLLVVAGQSRQERVRLKAGTE